MARFVELRRHTDSAGDVLTDQGVAAALHLGAGLTGGYRFGVSTGAQRATQTLACFLAALGQPVPGGVIVEPGLRSEREERWRAAYQRAGSGELEGYAPPTLSWSPTTRSAWGPRSGGCWSSWERGTGRWSLGTARPTRRLCSASPARW